MKTVNRISIQINRDLDGLELFENFRREMACSDDAQLISMVGVPVPSSRIGEDENEVPAFERLLGYYNGVDEHLGKYAPYVVSLGMPAYTVRGYAAFHPEHSDLIGTGTPFDGTLLLGLDSHGNLQISIEWTDDSPEAEQFIRNSLIPRFGRI